MTCDEAAELIYRFSETKPSSEAQKEFQEHIRKCPPCMKFIRGLAQKADSRFEVGCGEIPTPLLEEFSILMKKNLEGMKGS
ncbi:MAG: hypothetical protein A3A81_03880 [Omnitrophica bacterium RIFCSPLOWO2_01_FULL_45_10b]|nr:MAG: hypothetical protein A3A81_03880 [Omnitrophica bacterium RIFCSPLOWO2_01_FULL_45_10b]